MRPQGSDLGFRFCSFREGAGSGGKGVRVLGREISGVKGSRV